MKFDQEQIVEREKMRQEKAKLVNKQLTDVAQYLGGANKIVSMLNTGLDKFLKANMKSLEKQEEESRESQLNTDLRQYPNSLAFELRGSNSLFRDSKYDTK